MCDAVEAVKNLSTQAFIQKVANSERERESRVEPFRNAVAPCCRHNSGGSLFIAMHRTLQIYKSTKTERAKEREERESCPWERKCAMLLSWSRASSLDIATAHILYFETELNWNFVLPFAFSFLFFCLSGSNCLACNLQTICWCSSMPAYII